MIRDVMVWLDGGISDEVRLAAVAEIARRLESKVIIGLFLNPLPSPGPVDGDVSGALTTAELMERAREAGDKTEALLASRSLSGQSRSGGSMCWLTTSPILLPARRAPPTPLLQSAQWRDGSRAVGRRRFVRIGPEPLSGSRDGATKDRLQPHPGRLERQPGIGPSPGRSHAVSIPGG